MLRVDCNELGQEVLVKSDGVPFRSLLEVIEKVDSFPEDYETRGCFVDNVYFMLSHDLESRLGFVVEFVVNEMKRVDLVLFNELFEEISYTKTDSAGSGLVSGRALKIRLPDYDSRNKKLDELAQVLREHSTLEEIKGWRNEKYPVYQQNTPYMLVERSMAGTLGILTAGVHINGYTFDTQTGQIKIWVPRRSKSKPTWPYMLDNLIAGAIAYPATVYETVMKEAMEEANFDKETVTKYLKATGVLSYMHYQKNLSDDLFDTEASFIVGEKEYTYDAQLPYNLIPTPNDGEVDSFNLMTLAQVMTALYNKEFKPNCGLVMVDFLIRHGYINVENEPNYAVILQKIHRLLPYETK